MLRNLIFSLRNIQIWAVPSRNEFDLLMLRNRGFRLRIVQIWTVLSSNEVDLLMLRNCVFRLRNFQKWAVPTRNVVDLLLLRNRVFRLRIVQTWLMSSCVSVRYFSGIAFSVFKRSDMSSATLQEVPFADAQESRFQGAKL